MSLSDWTWPLTEICFTTLPRPSSVSVSVVTFPRASRTVLTVVLFPFTIVVRTEELVPLPVIPDDDIEEEKEPNPEVKNGSSNTELWPKKPCCLRCGQMK
jgi:hypothetical protein